MGLSARQDAAELHGGDARYRNWIIHKKERNEENEKGNLEDDSASHRHCAHCTLYFTRSYELHVVHVEIKLFTKKLFELWVSK